MRVYLGFIYTSKCEVDSNPLPHHEQDKKLQTQTVPAMLAGCVKISSCAQRVRLSSCVKSV